MRSAHRFLVIGIAAFCVAIYLYTAAPFMLFEDAPRFLAAIVTLGIAQPAEPVYVFLAHWFTYLPFGSVVFRVQVFSALLAGGSLLLLYRLVNRILSRPLAIGKKNKVPMKQPPLLLAGIFSMLVLAFSYQFWSQAQNVETFILDCFIELVVLTLLFKDISHKTVFKLLAIVVVICGIATGTDPPVIASVYPVVLFVAWQWRRALGIRRLGFLFLLGVSGIVFAWSYLPFAELRKPLLNDINGLSFQGIWEVATGQGSNIYRPDLRSINGITWSPLIMLISVWRYLEMAWMDFTPVLLLFSIIGAVSLWRTKRYTFFLLFLVVVTNFTLSVLYISGNQESWFLQSDVIFAVFSGVGYAWVIELISTRVTKFSPKVTKAGLFTLAFIPLLYWLPTLNRHRWHFTQDYVDNLYAPIQKPAILIGAGDLWEATASYVYVTNYKSNVIPVSIAIPVTDWLRTNLASTSHIKVPDVSHYDYSISEGYSKFTNDFIADNISRYHIYLTQQAEELEGLAVSQHSLQIDSERFGLIPVGMLQEIIPKNKEPVFNASNFVYQFGNGFPQSRPRFLERSYSAELLDFIRVLALSYDNAGSYLMYQGKYDEAGSFYRKANALVPKEPVILGDLGKFYAKQNQPAIALDYYRKAQTYQPDNPTWLYNIALTEGQLGKIDEEKKDIKRIINNPQVDAGFKQSLTEQLNSLNQNTSSSEAVIKSKMLSIPLGWKQFTNTAMNLTFNYPQTFRLNQMSPQLVSISNSPSADTADQLLVYSAEVSDLRKIPLPYPISGKLVQQQPVQFPGFQALIDVYSDPSGQTQLLLLHKGQHLVAVRFPKGTSIDKEVLNQIVQSIATVH
jgi:tetratricopeptide (TPR) repeat protein